MADFEDTPSAEGIFKLFNTQSPAQQLAIQACSTPEVVLPDSTIGMRSRHLQRKPRSEDDKSPEEKGEKAPDDLDQKGSAERRSDETRSDAKRQDGKRPDEKRPNPKRLDEKRPVRKTFLPSKKIQFGYWTRKTFITAKSRHLSCLTYSEMCFASAKRELFLHNSTMLIGLFTSTTLTTISVLSQFFNSGAECRQLKSIVIVNAILGFISVFTRALKMLFHWGKKGDMFASLAAEYHRLAIQFDECLRFRPSDFVPLNKAYQDLLGSLPPFPTHVQAQQEEIQTKIQTLLKREEIERERLVQKYKEDFKHIRSQVSSSSSSSPLPDHPYNDEKDFSTRSTTFHERSGARKDERPPQVRVQVSEPVGLSLTESRID